MKMLTFCARHNFLELHVALSAEYKKSVSVSPTNKKKSLATCTKTHAIIPLVLTGVLAKIKK